MNFGDLDDEQREVVRKVVDSREKLLTLGRPGTGKTTAALWSARRFLEVNAGSKVLFLTFSRSAVSQIVARQKGVLANHGAQVEIQTFHAFAFRLLKAFGRYMGFGSTTPTVQSEARVKLLGQDNRQFRYADLLPSVIRLLEDSPLIRDLINRRWGLIICDEAQDLNAEQLRLVELLSPERVLFLGDPNQMIYEFTGSSPEVFQKVQTRVDDVVLLTPRSHRDPTGLMPAIAEAVRNRDFNHEVLREAISSGRLVIHFDVETSDLPTLLCNEVRRILRFPGDVGVFAHGNLAVSHLAEVLHEDDIDHVLVGIPEAHAEALKAMMVQLEFAVGENTREEIRESLALFLTASTRQSAPPSLALGLIGAQSLPEIVEIHLEEYIERLTSMNGDSTVGELATLIAASWPTLSIQAAYRIWSHASSHFLRLVSLHMDSLPTQDVIFRIKAIVDDTFMNALLLNDYSERSRVKLMNYHQTKGREADTVIHVFRDNEFYGHEDEPYETASRLINVAISRARKTLIVILPPYPHALVAPFYGLQQA